MWSSTYLDNIGAGRRSQVVKAVGCDSTIRGFDSRRLPSPFKEGDLFLQYKVDHVIKKKKKN
jgi:hypothetical protein